MPNLWGMHEDNAEMLLGRVIFFSTRLDQGVVIVCPGICSLSFDVTGYSILGNLRKVLARVYSKWLKTLKSHSTFCQLAMCEQLKFIA